MNVVFIVFAQDILSNYVYPVAGYPYREDADKRLRKEKKKHINTNYRLWVDGVKVEENKTGA